MPPAAKRSARPSGRALRERWGDPAFLAEALPAIEHMLRTRQFHAADLRGMAMATPNAIPPLQQQNLYNAQLTEVDLSYCHVATSIANSKFVRVQFDHGWLEQAYAKSSTFSDCSFVSAKVGFVADDAVFTSCNFQSSKFVSHWWSGGALRARFVNCDFSNAHLRRVAFRASHFEGCTFDGCLFDECDIRGTRFDGAEPVFKDCMVLTASSPSSGH